MAGLTATFTQPFYDAQTATSSAVPGKFPVALAGRTYLIDTARQDWGRASIKLLRDQADTGDRPGERSINPDDLWRRAIESWHHGAGQSWNDRDDANPNRFRSSKGVDVWDKWELKLLPAVDQKLTSSNLSAITTVGTNEVWVQDGNTIKYTGSIDTDSPSWSSATGTPATASGSLTSDGRFVYSAWGTSGIYRNTANTAASSSYATGTVTVVRHVKGRLMAAGGPSIYNVTASGALPTPLFTHPLTDFEWQDFGAGPSHIYAIGHINDRTTIYKITIKPDGTALDAPIVAGELPAAEVGRAIHGYLGYILIGTDFGVRFAVPDAAGNLEIGSLIETSRFDGCAAFEGQDRFVWFGWPNYDSISTGLGRLDLSTFTAPNTPAYASDLMVPGTGQITGIVTASDLRVFAVATQGVFAVEEEDLVTSGTLDPGDIGFNLPDPKVSMSLDVRHEALDGTVEALLSVDGGTFNSLGTNTAAESTSYPFPTGERRGERFEPRLKLTRSSTDTTAGPVVTRLTLFAYPAPTRRGRWVLPLLIRSRMTPPRSQQPTEYDVVDELDFIIGLVAAASPVSLQFGNQNFSVLVEDYEWRPETELNDGSGWEGTCQVTLKMLSSQ